MECTLGQLHHIISQGVFKKLEGSRGQGLNINRLPTNMLSRDKKHKYHYHRDIYSRAGVRCLEDLYLEKEIL